MKKAKLMKQNYFMASAEWVTDGHLIISRQEFLQRITYSPAVDARIDSLKGDDHLMVEGKDIATDFKFPDISKHIAGEGHYVVNTGIRYREGCLWMSTCGTVKGWIQDCYSVLLDQIGADIYFDGKYKFYLERIGEKVGALSSYVDESPTAKALEEAAESSRKDWADII